MLKLSKKVDYGLMSLMHLAQRTERASWNTREISENYDIPLELLAKILQKLVQKGLLVSHAGKVFDETGEIVDQQLRAQLQQFVHGFVGFVKG